MYTGLSRATRLNWDAEGQQRSDHDLLKYITTKLRYGGVPEGSVLPFILALQQRSPLLVPADIHRIVEIQLDQPCMLVSHEHSQLKDPAAGRLA